jgi:hypothetical protein
MYGAIIGTPRRSPASVGHERAAMAAICALALLCCVLGLAARPSASTHEGFANELLDLLRVATTAALSITLLLGPGLAWRRRRQSRLDLAFVPLPGLALLVATGGLTWLLAVEVSAQLVSALVLVPVLTLLLADVVRAAPEEVLAPEERRVLAVVGCVLAIGIAHALWSVGPSGELYSGTVSRTLETGDRPDSRISFHVVQLVAHGDGPYSPQAGRYFFPFNFSTRGPVAGIASAPIVLVSGGRPPTGLPNQPWAPFDAQGFMAYRLAMMAAACTVFLSLWTLTRRLAGRRAAYLAVLLAATTPFLVHEVWFTWPKPLAASFVLLAAVCLIGRRPLAAGVLAGTGYLVHPMALLSYPALGLLALWPLTGARLRRPRVRQATLWAVGAAAFVLAWRLVNGSHYTQDDFVNYLTSANGVNHVSLGAWTSSRLVSLGNTLVPLFLPLFHSDDPHINVFGGTSPAVIHFFFQYWTGLPFGAAIVFFPLLLFGLWRAARRWPWPFFLAVLLPFLVFAIYWGSFTTGLLREGLQTWVVTLFAVLAVEQKAEGFAWLRSRPIRGLLAFRSAEVFAVAVIPTLATRHRVIGSDFILTDVLALLALAAACVLLALLVWRTHRPEARQRPAADT